MAAQVSRPAAFLDRDGVLIVDSGYPHRPEDLVFIPGAIEAVALLNRARYFVIVVTNQSGVARGLFTEAQVDAFHAAMAAELARHGAHIDAIYVCPYHEDAVVPRYRAVNHPDRKPNPGMILRALADWPIDPRRSFLIGDRPTDLQAADAAGIAGHLFASGDLRDLVGQALDAAAQPR